MTRRNRKTEVSTVRCAIYTRKSTDEGLEQEFNSLDAQRDSGEAYIASQKHGGWQCLPEHYDDGGFTGGNMERAGLQQQLRDDNDRLQVAAAVTDDVERVSSLAEAQERIRNAERRLTEIDNELITLNGELVDDAEAGNALANFENLWQALVPRESQWHA